MSRYDTGVALIVVNPEGHVLVVQELETNIGHGKVAGMCGIPMETSHEGEFDQMALQRLVQEELSGMHVDIEGVSFGNYQVMPGIWVRLYLGSTGDSSLPSKDTPTDGVTGHAWLSVQEATGLWLRRGAWEMLRDYEDGQRGVSRETCRAVTARVDQYFKA